jgi:alpha-galactosidase
MPGLARELKAMGARPGIWMRPLLTTTEVPEHWKAAAPRPEASGFTLDPSVPEVLDRVRADITRLREWGYELIKHDFSTFDVTGRWGFEMDAGGFAPDGWAFADNARTTAEILLEFYRAIRDAAGPDCLLVGCNTTGHLAAGLVEIQRIGDDTSASDWDRTRRMGVNTLAFRAVQHGAFFAADADCVPVSPHVPWRLTEAWLDLVARSGTPLFLSIDPAACGSEQRAGIRRALAAAVRDAPVAEPLDWLDTAIPALWRLQGEDVRFDWCEWD